MSKHKFADSKLLYILTALILVGGFVFWQSDLTSDPPLYYAGMGQSLSTDPAQYVYHARNKVLFDDWDPFDYPRWLVYQRSLTSMVAYLWFSVAGVSLKQANMVGVLLSLGGLLFFLLAVAKSHRPWVALAVALCYTVSINLIVYGRLSYLENGLIFIMALLFFVYSHWGDRMWGIVLSGAVVALATLMGKLFGALLMPAVLLAILFSESDNRWKRVFLAVGSFVAGIVAFVFVLYGSNLSAVGGYFGEQSYGLRGFPEGLSTPWGFIEHLISFGFESRLFYRDLNLVLLLFSAGVVLTLYLLCGESLRKLSRVSRLAIFACGCIIVGIMPLNYSPLRYALFLVPVIFVSCFTLLDQMSRIKEIKLKAPGYVPWVILFLLSWHALYQVIGVSFFVNNIPVRQLTWSTLPVALALTLAMKIFVTKKDIAISRRFLNILPIALVLVSVAFGLYRINEHLTHRTFDIAGANEDLGRILGDNAVVSGPYAPALTVDNNLKSFIHLFGVAKVDSALFEKQPVTHLAIDESNWTVAVEQYPHLKDLLPITLYWIRDYGIRIYDISRVYGNNQALDYQRTLYERAIDFYNLREMDSTVALMGQFLTTNPDCRSANIIYAEVLIAVGRFGEAEGVLNSLTRRYPYDYYTNLVCGRSYQIMGLARGDQRLLGVGRAHYQKAVQNNPYKATYAQRLFQETQQKFGPSGR